MGYSIDDVRRIAARHGITGDIALLPNSGMVNEAWSVGNCVVRILKDDENSEEALQEPKREAAVVPLAREAGIRTPELVAVDFDCDIVPLPYTIYRRAEGALLGHLDIEPESCTHVYRELGREIALLQSVQVPEEVLRLLRKGQALDGVEQVGKALAAGKITREEAAEISGWFARLEEGFGEPEKPCLLHSDIHPWNLFVHRRGSANLELAAIIDWGDAGYEEPAVEFSSMPICAVQPMLEGFVEAGGCVGEGLIQRSLHAGLGLALWEVRELSEEDFSRRWWRMPAGGWPVMREFLERAVGLGNTGWLGRSSGDGTAQAAVT